MSSNQNEIAVKLGEVQTQIWQTVSLTSSEASSQEINFCDPITVVTKGSDLYSEIGAPMLVIQFSFAGLPENAQVLLLPQDTFMDLAGLVKKETVAAVDENLVADIRPVLESLVQGICLAVGNLRNEPVVASGLSIRFQIPSVPPNLQRVEEVIRTQVAIQGDELNGSGIWVLDSDTAHMILGMEAPELDEEQESSYVSTGPSPRSSKGAPADHGIEILLDIPLEISVELGRVRMMVKEVVELGTGSIIELDKAAGEPVDVLVNGRVVAKGEVVVIEDNFGVRITEILNPQDRLNRLNEVA